MEQAIAALPADEKRYGVRMRSMLTSVLVATTDSTRRDELAREAAAIAEADGDAELIASAQLARRLALWRRDDLDERTAAVLIAVAEARRSGNVHLELTAPLFAMSDLLELGRADEHRALLESFRARAATLHMPMYEVYAHFIEANHRLAAGEYAEAQRLADLALEMGRAAHGVNAEIVYAGIKFRMAQDLDRRVALLDESERMVQPTRGCASGRSPASAPSSTPAAATRSGPPSRSWSARTACACRTTRCSSSRPARSSLPPRHSGTRCGPVSCGTLEPYADRLAVSGLGGISIGPVSRYVGVAAMVSGDVDAAARYLQQAVGRGCAPGQPGPRGPDPRRPRRRPGRPQPPG